MTARGFERLFRMDAQPNELPSPPFVVIETFVVKIQTSAFSI
jgi:hypothetical protein